MSDDMSLVEAVKSCVGSEDVLVNKLLEAVVDSIREYERFTIKGVKSSCTKCRKNFQAVKKASDALRANALELKGQMVVKKRAKKEAISVDVTVEPSSSAEN